MTQAWTFDLSMVNAGITSAVDVAVNVAGTFVYACDDVNARIFQWDGDGNFIRTFGGAVAGFTGLSDPFSVAVSPVNGHVYVTDYGHRRVVEFQADGTWVATWGTSGSGNGQFGTGGMFVSVAADGTVVVADVGLDRVQTFTSAGTFIAVILSSVNSSNGFLTASDSTWWVLANPVIGYDLSGSPVRSVTMSPAPAADFLTTGYGSGYNFYFLDDTNNLVLVYAQSGALLGTFGSAGSGPGQFNHPTDLNQAQSKLFVADQNNKRVQRWSITDVVDSGGPFVILGRGAC